MDYTDRLRRLTINDPLFADDSSGAGVPLSGLDPKTLALVRLAALVAVGGAPPSYSVETDDAITAGATTEEIVDVLVGVMPIVGRPCVVSAAPSLALALGYDPDDPAA